MVSFDSGWVPPQYKPSSIPTFAMSSLVVHALLFALAYQTGVFTEENIESQPAKVISVSLVEPTPVIPPKPKPLPKPKPKPVTKKKIVAKAPSTKTVQNKPKIVPKVVKPEPPKVVEKIAASPLPSPVKTPSAIATPKPTYQPKPKYPTIARRRGVEGVVILDVSIANNGHVTNAHIVQSSGSSALDRSALNAIKTWQFPPSPFNSLSSFKQKIEFRLNRY